jgi:hypothetical protein
LHPTLAEAIRLADGTLLFDNSLSSGPRLLLQIRGASIEANKLEKADAFHCRIAEVVSDALSMSTEAVLRAANPG